MVTLVVQMTVDRIDMLLLNGAVWDGTVCYVCKYVSVIVYGQYIMPCTCVVLVWVCVCLFVYTQYSRLH